MLVADDHPVVRHGLKQIINEATGMTAVGEAGNAEDVLAYVRAGSGEVLLLDLAMPGSQGTDLLEAVKRERPELRVLVLSMYPVDQYAVRALRAGASAYMTKESAAEEPVRAVRAVHSGARYLTTEVAHELAAELGATSERPLYQRLSNREYQVLRLLGSALTVGQIARQLHISEKTVSTYRSRLLEKIHLRTTSELIRYAVQNRLEG